MGIWQEHPTGIDDVGSGCLGNTVLWYWAYGFGVDRGMCNQDHPMPAIRRGPRGEHEPGPCEIDGTGADRDVEPLR